MYLKAIPYIIAALIGAGLTVGVTMLTAPEIVVKAPEIPKCPDCNCPPSVSLNGFDVDKLNNKKGTFHLHNTISNVTVNVDSLMLRQLIQASH
jgi:hypothetical protein